MHWQSHQSRSSQPRPEGVSYAERMTQLMGHHQVKAEPWNDPPAPLAHSEKEKIELVGKCYLCKGPGHIAQNCPQGNKLTYYTGKPSDASNFHIEFEEDEFEVLESLPLGMIDIEQDPVTSDWQENYSNWNLLGACVRPVIGDCYAIIAKYILSIQ